MPSPLKYLVPRTGLYHWCSADDTVTVSSGQIIDMDDLSGNGTALRAFSPYPTYVDAVANAANRPGLSFNGFNTSPMARNGSFVLYNAFIVASTPSYIFPSTLGGLIGGTSTGDPGILVTGQNTSNFYDFGYPSNICQYRRANKSYANNAQLGPIYNLPRVMEVRFPFGATLSGIQIGLDRGFSGRVYSGTVFEWMIYSRVISESERTRLYQYFARKYWTWEQTGSVPYDVHPGAPNWGSEDESRKKALIEDNEDGTRLSRVKVSTKRYFDLQYNNKLREEVDAVKTFYDQKYPGADFVYRDRTIYPAADIVVNYQKDATVPALANGHISFSYKQTFKEK